MSYTLLHYAISLGQNKEPMIPTRCHFVSDLPSFRAGMHQIRRNNSVIYGITRQMIEGWETSEIGMRWMSHALFLNLLKRRIFDENQLSCSTVVLVASLLAHEGYHSYLFLKRTHLISSRIFAWLSLPIGIDEWLILSQIYPLSVLCLSHIRMIERDEMLDCISRSRCFSQFFFWSTWRSIVIQMIIGKFSLRKMWTPWQRILSLSLSRLCPYDLNHKMLAKRFQIHVMRCAKVIHEDLPDPTVSSLCRRIHIFAVWNALSMRRI